MKYGAKRWIKLLRLEKFLLFCCALSMVIISIWFQLVVESIYLENKEKENLVTLGDENFSEDQLTQKMCQFIKDLWQAKTEEQRITILNKNKKYMSHIEKLYHDEYLNWKITLRSIPLNQQVNMVSAKFFSSEQFSDRAGGYKVIVTVESTNTMANDSYEIEFYINPNHKILYHKLRKI